jgi:hypothetical protein
MNTKQALHLEILPENVYNLPAMQERSAIELITKKSIPHF